MADIIINADDFGMNERNSRAIAEAFSEGLITDTTMMANGAHFDGAVATLRRPVTWIAAWLIVLSLLTGLPCAAASGFYCEYTPKTATGAVFYIDINAEDAVSAAVLELRFDSAVVAYREAITASSTSTVRSSEGVSSVTIAVADSSAVQGRLCRVAFRALQAGACTFTLHVVQAADGTPKRLSDYPDATLEVQFGQDDIVAESPLTPAEPERSLAGERSSLQGAPTAGREPEAPEGGGGALDLRRNRPLTYMLIGAGAMVLIAVLVVIGVIIGRKTAHKKNDTNQKEKDTTRLSH